ncbi:MAG TPA: AAA family ATPase, partial [Clostridiales bacterium]|nr:AAA family ATPase [Clostridiales bacterium]
MKEFNIAGVCIPEMHYMVDISAKLENITKLINKGKYFTINRSRQFGKTTTLYMLEQKIKEKYIVISTSFEGIGGDILQDEKKFSSRILGIFADDMRFVDKEMSDKLNGLNTGIENLDDLSKTITELCYNSEKKIVLMIDEVDKSCDNQLFLHFLGMLRNKYLDRDKKKDYTFHSVILAGVHDVKSLKLKLRPEEETKYNSPWNIAEDFEVDMTFNREEIATMLNEYEEENKIGMDIGEISEEIYKYTSGYPFLVSKICKVIDEKINKIWTIESVEQAVKIILKENNTLFESLIKNLENDRKLYGVIYEVIVNGVRIGFNIHNQVQSKAAMYGIIKSENDRVKVQNIIFEKLIYNYMISNRETSSKIETKYADRNKFVNSGILDMELILDKFQELMMQEYREKDEDFIEKKGRLIFL